MISRENPGAAAARPGGGGVICDCGAISPAGRNICRTCLRSLEGRPEATDAETAVIERRQARLRQRARRRRLLRIGLVVVIALLPVAWLLRGWLRGPPPPLPLPRGDRSIASAVAAEWPLPSGGGGGDRVTAAVAAFDGAAVWEWAPAARLITPLVTDGEALYVGLSDGRLVAIEASDGSERWSAPVPGALDAAPAVAGGRLYVGFRDGTAAAIDAMTGAEIWRADVGNAVSSTPLVVAGMVVVAANGLMVGLDAEDGSELWRQAIDDSLVMVTPANDGRLIAVATFQRVLFFDRVNGQQTSWFQFTQQHAPTLSVAVVDQTVVAVSDGQVAAFDVAMRRPWWDGIRPAWRVFHIMGAAPQPPWRPDLWSMRAPREPYAAAVAGGRVIVAGGRGDVFAVSSRGGELLWRLSMSPVTAAPLLTADGLLLPIANAIVVVDPSSGDELRRIPMDGVTAHEIVVTDGGTYVRTASGSIVAFR